MPDLRVASDEHERARLAAAALGRLADARGQDDAAAQQAAVGELVELHLDVARAIAGRYRRRGIAADDLEQVASLALIRAVHHYETERGTEFLAYAVPVIRGDLRHHFRDHGWVVRPPRRVQELQGRVVRERDHQPADPGEHHSDRLARQLGTTVTAVEEALAAEGCFTPLSLDRPVSGGRERGVADTLVDTLRDSRDDAAAEARAVLRSPVRNLDARDRRILGMRFFEQLTQQEMADALGVTQTQVSKLVARILRDLRADVGSVDADAWAREEGAGRREHLPHPA